jgi:hypothetical protein
MRIIIASCDGKSVIVHDLGVIRTVLRPYEAYPVPVVDADAVLSFPVTFQSFKPVARRYPQFVERIDRIELIELPRGNSPEVRRARIPRGPCISSVKDIFRASVFERLYHDDNTAYMLTQ